MYIKLSFNLLSIWSWDWRFEEKMPVFAAEVVPVAITAEESKLFFKKDLLCMSCSGFVQSEDVPPKDRKSLKKHCWQWSYRNHFSYFRLIFATQQKFFYLKVNEKLPFEPERCQSGRSGRSRKPLYGQPYRGFESLPLR